MKLKKCHFKFLDELRESGETNMLGARPHLQEEFGMGKEYAGFVLSAWMKTFDSNLTVEQRLKNAKEAC